VHGLVGNFAWLEERAEALCFSVVAWRGLANGSIMQVTHARQVHITPSSLFVTATASDSLARLARSIHHLRPSSSLSSSIVAVAEAACTSRAHQPPLSTSYWLAPPIPRPAARERSIEEAGRQRSTSSRLASSKQRVWLRWSVRAVRA
jgi:hypothetical protein